MPFVLADPALLCKLSGRAQATALRLLQDAAVSDRLSCHLIQLELCDCGLPLSSQQWSCICQLQGLQILRLVHTDYGEGGIEDLTNDISQLSSLRDLTVYWGWDTGTAQQTSDGIKLLTHLTNLQLLASVTGSCLHHITAVTSLCQLRLSYVIGNLLIPDSLSGLQSLRALKLLEVTFDGRIEAVGALTGLQHFSCHEYAFEHSTSQAVFFRMLSRLTALTLLDLMYPVAASRTMQSTVLIPLCNLIELSLNGVPLASFTPSDSWQALERLYLVDNQLRDVPRLTGLVSLRELIISSQQEFQISQPLAWVTSLPALQRVDLRRRQDGTRWNAHSLMHLAEALYRADALCRKPALMIQA